MIHRHISEEIEDIHNKLLKIEKDTDKINFTLKAIVLLTNKKFEYSLPHDIIHLCF